LGEVNPKNVLTIRVIPPKETNMVWSLQTLSGEYNTHDSQKELSLKETPFQLGFKAGQQLFCRERMISTYRSSYITLDVEPEDTIQKIQQKLQDRIGWLPEDMRLIFAGKQLEESMTLKRSKNSKRIDTAPGQTIAWWCVVGVM
jgi:hypothetical protein